MVFICQVLGFFWKGAEEDFFLQSVIARVLKLLCYSSKVTLLSLSTVVWVGVMDLDAYIQVLITVSLLIWGKEVRSVYTHRPNLYFYLLYLTCRTSGCLIELVSKWILTRFGRIFFSFSRELNQQRCRKKLYFGSGGDVAPRSCSSLIAFFFNVTWNKMHLEMTTGVFIQGFKKRWWSMQPHVMSGCPLVELKVKRKYLDNRNVLAEFHFEGKKSHVAMLSYH